MIQRRMTKALFPPASSVRNTRPPHGRRHGRAHGLHNARGLRSHQHPYLRRGPWTAPCRRFESPIRPSAVAANCNASATLRLSIQFGRVQTIDNTRHAGRRTASWLERYRVKVALLISIRFQPSKMLPRGSDWPEPLAAVGQDRSVVTDPAGLTRSTLTASPASQKPESRSPATCTTLERPDQRLPGLGIFQRGLPLRSSAPHLRLRFAGAPDQRHESRERHRLIYLRQ